MATRIPAKTTPRSPARRAAAPAAAGQPEKKGQGRAAKETSKAARPAKEEKPAKAKKPAKPKVVRDSFSMPRADYAILQDLKSRAARLGRPVKKSEVLRAAVQALATMGDAAFLAQVGALPETRA